MNIATIYCDGSFSRKREASGYGVVAILGGKKKEFSERCEGFLSAARAELMGAIRAIEVFGPKADVLHVYSDSKYLVDGAQRNLQNWIDRKWDKPIVHKDLWLTLNGLMKRYQIEWFWVKAHSGVEHNERADELAKQVLMG